MDKKETIYGINPVLEALRSGRRDVFEIILIPKGEGKVSEIKELARKKNVRLVERGRKDIDDMLPEKKHQGVIASVSPYAYFEIEEVTKQALQDDLGGFIVILDGITDPQNLGAIIRTAHLLGVHGIVIPKDNSASVNATVVKASAGAAEHTQIVQATNIVRVIDFLKDNGFWASGAASEGAEMIYRHEFKRENVVLVIGSEGKGLRRLVSKKCDRLISIPMKGNIDSYNASAAAAIIISEISRQRGF